MMRSPFLKSSNAIISFTPPLFSFSFKPSAFSFPPTLSNMRNLSLPTTTSPTNGTKNSISSTPTNFDLSSIPAIDWLPNPIVVRGKVQRGFGRGSKQLGTPTANLPGTLLENVPQAARDGVYLGFGRVPKFGNEVVKMVANVGRNITFDDVTERVLEAYLMSDIFTHDFYEEEMRLCIIGFMRPEWKFSSLDELILHIQNDVQVAKQALDLPNAQEFSNHPSLTE